MLRLPPLRCYLGAEATARIGFNHMSEATFSTPVLSARTGIHLQTLKRLAAQRAIIGSDPVANGQAHAFTEEAVLQLEIAKRLRAAAGVTEGRYGRADWTPSCAAAERMTRQALAEAGSVTGLLLRLQSGEPVWTSTAVAPGMVLTVNASRVAAEYWQAERGQAAAAASAA
ncbi:MAG: hypothetical protein AAFR84_06460 [Pseudomonadota bacterium]